MEFLYHEMFLQQQSLSLNLNGNPRKMLSVLDKRQHLPSKQGSESLQTDRSDLGQVYWSFVDGLQLCLLICQDS